MPTGNLPIYTNNDGNGFLPKKNYRVKSKNFCRLLARLRTGEPTPEDATKITNLHLAYYEHDTEFIKYLKENHKSMWLYAKNIDKDKKYGNANSHIQAQQCASC